MHTPDEVRMTCWLLVSTVVVMVFAIAIDSHEYERRLKNAFAETLAEREMRMACVDQFGDGSMGD